MVSRGTAEFCQGLCKASLFTMDSFPKVQDGLRGDKQTMSPAAIHTVPSTFMGSVRILVLKAAGNRGAVNMLKAPNDKKHSI